jgi:hypothetical protein
VRAAIANFQFFSQSGREFDGFLLQPQNFLGITSLSCFFNFFFYPLELEVGERKRAEAVLTLRSQELARSNPFGCGSVKM